MEQRGIDCLLLSIGSDLPYLTGYQAMPMERVTMLVLAAEGEPTLIVPGLEAPRVDPGPFRIEPWEETDDPLMAIAAAAGRPAVAAIGGETWSAVLLGLLSRMTETTFVSASSVMTELRIRKDSGEIEALRVAASAADRVAARIPNEVRFERRSERAVARDIADLLLEEGHEKVEFTIVGSGPNGASPHHDPTDRRIKHGDAVVLDFGGKLDRYCSDTTRTFVVGDTDPVVAEIHAVVVEAQRAAFDSATTGITAESVDRAARDVITAAGYGDRFIHRLGHGIGLDTHEAPYLVSGNHQTLEPGMAFSLEPGIYIPRRFGVRVEDICFIDDDGACVLLNESPRALVSVE